MVRIGIDLMGNGTSPRLLLQEVLSHRSSLSHDVSLCFLGSRDVFLELAPYPGDLFLETSSIITMEDDPIKVVRSKLDSSMIVGIMKLQEGFLDAFISCGNTGALLTAATLHVPLLPNIPRAALLTLIPSQKEDVAVVDVGANSSYKKDHLVAFAKLGASFQQQRGITTPRIGLLNMGIEASKGPVEHRLTYEALQQLPPSYGKFVGNIEAREVFLGEIDVLVTDGFTGNIFLKTAEGSAALILHQLQTFLIDTKNKERDEILTALAQRAAYTEYPGAFLVGIKPLLMKCHGTPTSATLLSSIKEIARLRAC